MRVHAGEHAKNCGTVDIGEGQSMVDACVKAALGKTPFIAQYRQQSDDSKVTSGVAGNSQGAVKWFSHDNGSPSGNETIHAAGCNDPTPNNVEASDPLEFISPIKCNGGDEDADLMCEG